MKEVPRRLFSVLVRMQLDTLQLRSKHMQNKTYTESEISDIISQAARLQAIEGTIGQEGLTLDEIKEAAVEAGIDPQFVDIASSVSSNHKKAYWSIPTAINRSMFVRGRLTDEAWGHMVNHFVRTFGGPGKTEVKEGRRSWKRDFYSFTVEERGDQLVLHAEADWSKELELPFALSIVGMIATMMIGMVAFLAEELGFGVVFLIMATLVSGFFVTYRNRQQARQEKTRQLFEATLNRSVILIQSNFPDREAARNEVSETLLEENQELLESEQFEGPELTSLKPQNKRIRS